MRIIEQKMIKALSDRRYFQQGNTMANNNGDVYLYGNHLGTYCAENGVFTVNLDTLRSWPTATTKSRLQAIGIDVYTRYHVTYIGDQAINEIPGDRLECAVYL